MSDQLENQQIKSFEESTPEDIQQAFNENIERVKHILEIPDALTVVNADTRILQANDRNPYHKDSERIYTWFTPQVNEYIMAHARALMSVTSEKVQEYLALDSAEGSDDDNFYYRYFDECLPKAIEALSAKDPRYKAIYENLDKYFGIEFGIGVVDDVLTEMIQQFGHTAYYIANANKFHPQFIDREGIPSEAGCPYAGVAQLIIRKLFSHLKERGMLGKSEF